MALQLTAKLDLTLSWVYKDVASPSGREAVDNNQLQLRDSLASGTGLDAGDRKFDDQRTVNDGANDDLDLSGVLVDRFGNSVTFAKVKGIVIRNRNTTAGHILSVGGGSNTFSTWLGAAGDIIKIGPNGLFVLWNPSLAAYAVTAGTGDILRVSASGGNISYDIALLGTSA